MANRDAIPIFTGWDKREEIGWHVFTSSVLRHSSRPVCFYPINSSISGIRRSGTNAFTYSRYLIPWLKEYKGSAIFMDGADMLCLSDIAELYELFNPFYAVQVVPHNYQTKHHLKYIGTDMESRNENYPRKNWSSVMLVNCGHMAWKKIDPHTIDTMNTTNLHRFSHIDERFIGFLPFEWNWLVGEYPRNDLAKIVHYTLGIPSFPYYKDCDWSKEWNEVKDSIFK